MLRLNFRYSAFNSQCYFISKSIKVPHRKITIKQRHGTGSSAHWNTVNFNPNSSFTPPRISPLASVLTIKQRLRDTLFRVFLPQGYPETARKEYLTYSGWQFCNSLSGTISNTLSTQALLQALGMGVGSAVGMAATTNWIIKDGFGLLGGVLYAGIVSNKFDSHPKKYRFFATCAIQLATLAELLTPLFPLYFLPMASLSNVGKNIGWLAAGATRAALHRGLTKADNLGDLTAKAGVQNTAAGLIGTGLGVGLSMIIGTDPMMLISAFIPLCIFNLWTAYKTNTSIVTRTMNVERAEMVLKPCTHHLATVYNESQGSVAAKASQQCPNQDVPSLLLSAEDVSRKESFIFAQKKEYAIPIVLETNLENFCSHLSSNEKTRLLDALLGQTMQQSVVPPYRMFLTSHGDAGIQIYVWYLEDVDSQHIFMGFFHACLVRSILELYPHYAHHPEQLIASTSPLLEGTFPLIYHRLEQLGWDLQHTHLSEGVNGRISIVK